MNSKACMLCSFTYYYLQWTSDRLFVIFSFTFAVYSNRKNRGSDLTIDQIRVASCEYVGNLEGRMFFITNGDEAVIQKIR